MRWTEEQYQNFIKASKQSSAPTKTKVLITDGYRSNVAGWRTIGGKKYYLKSLYEINFSHYVEWLRVKGEIIDWLYEPQVFSFPKDVYRTGPFYYRPDFKLIQNNKAHQWVEVKGYLNPSSKKKITRFNKHHSAKEGNLLIIDGDWFKAAFKQGLNKIIPGWESLPK